MKPSSRFLIGTLVVIAALVIVTVGLVLATTGKPPAELLPENTPEGVVQRFMIALQNSDYPKAYSYLSIDQNGRKLDYNSWRNSMPMGATSRWQATLGKSTTTGDTAEVAVTVDVFSPGGLFSNPVRTNTVTFLLKKVSAIWYITSPQYLWFIY